jgi:hypothetical protein
LKEGFWLVPSRRISSNHAPDEKQQLFPPLSSLEAKQKSIKKGEIKRKEKERNFPCGTITEKSKIRNISLLHLCCRSDAVFPFSTAESSAE